MGLETRQKTASPRVACCHGPGGVQRCSEGLTRLSVCPSVAPLPGAGVPGGPKCRLASRALWVAFGCHRWFLVDRSSAGLALLPGPERRLCVQQLLTAPPPPKCAFVDVQACGQGLLGGGGLLGSSHVSSRPPSLHPQCPGWRGLAGPTRARAVFPCPVCVLAVGEQGRGLTRLHAGHRCLQQAGGAVVPETGPPAAASRGGRFYTNLLPHWTVSTLLAETQGVWGDDEVSGGGTWPVGAVALGTPPPSAPAHAPSAWARGVCHSVCARAPHGAWCDTGHGRLSPWGPTPGAGAGDVGSGVEGRELMGHAAAPGHRGGGGEGPQQGGGAQGPHGGHRALTQGP